MKPIFGVTKSGFNISYASLCVIGQALWKQQTLAKLRRTKLISRKSHDHLLRKKLIDAFLVILAGYPSLCLINRTFRSAAMIANSWHRSTISCTLLACTGPSLTGLRELNYQFWQSHSQLSGHDWCKRLSINLDLTSLPASVKAQDSTKGYVGKKTKSSISWQERCCIHIKKPGYRNCIRVNSTVVPV